MALIQISPDVIFGTVISGAVGLGGLIWKAATKLTKLDQTVRRLDSTINRLPCQLGHCSEEGRERI